MKRSWLFPSIALGLLLTAGTAQADGVIYADADSFLSSYNYGGPPVMRDRNYGGATNYDGMSPNNIRMVAYWDIDWGTVEDCITSASLALYGMGHWSNESTSGWTVSRLTEAWTEGTGTGQTTDNNNVTWNSRTTGTAWTTAGGSFTTAGQVSGSQTYISGWWPSPLDITEIVQYWADNPSENYGILINLDNSTTGSFRLYAREDSGGSRAPRLDITSEAGAVIPEPGTLLLLGTGALSLFGFIRRRRMN